MTKYFYCRNEHLVFKSLQDVVDYEDRVGHKCNIIALVPESEHHEALDRLKLDLDRVYQNMPEPKSYADCRIIEIKPYSPSKAMGKLLYFMEGDRVVLHGDLLKIEKANDVELLPLLHNAENEGLRLYINEEHQIVAETFSAKLIESPEA